MCEKNTTLEFNLRWRLLFVSEHHLNGKTAAEKVGVRPIHVWWTRGESNPLEGFNKALFFNSSRILCMNLSMNQLIEVAINLICDTDFFGGKGLLVNLFHYSVG